MNNVGMGHSHSQDGGDQLHVLVHGLGGSVGVGDQGEYGVHGEEDGLLGVIGPGINVFLSVFIHSVPRLKKSEFQFQSRVRLKVSLSLSL